MLSSEAPTTGDKFKVPKWTGKPPNGSHLDVSKAGQLIQKLLIDEKGCYKFGRNAAECDFLVEHNSASRVHALLLFHKVLSRFALVDLESLCCFNLGGQVRGQ